MAVTEMTVKREGGKVWIDNVNVRDTGIYASSVHGAAATILETLGESLGYDDLVCYGGFAFRANWHQAGCPSAGHPCCGYMCIDNGIRALPWKCKLYESFPWGTQRHDDQRAAFEAEACAAIKASIDRGIPVHYGSEEDGLIIGYADQGRRWWCVHPYHGPWHEGFWHDQVTGGPPASFTGGKWPWAITVWLKPKAPQQRADPRELLIAALTQAVDMWHTEKRGDYYCGDAAYEHWLTWLRDVEAGNVDNPKAGMQGNGWCYDVLVHSRRIASPWLRKQADLFDGEAREHLLAAAEHYGKIPPICMEGIDCPWSLAPQPNKADQWTGEMRRKQIARLEASRKHDAAAVAELEKALAALEAEE